MQIMLNQSRPGNLFWFTTDNRIFVNFRKPKVSIDAVDKLPVNIMRELILGHRDGHIKVDNLSYLEQLYKEQLKKIQGKQKSNATAKDLPKLNRRAKVVSLNEPVKKGNPAAELVSQPLNKIKTSLKQIANPDLLIDAYKQEQKNKKVRPTVLKLIEERLEELGFSVATIDSSEAFTVKEEKVGEIEIDPESKTIKPKE